MSKAEENAIQHCCTNCTNNKLNCGMKLVSHGRNCIACSNYIEGYHQAEKDLELGWEQIYSILYFEREVLREFGYEEHSNEEVCKEVLKRFKDFKERKRNDTTSK